MAVDALDQPWNVWHCMRGNKSGRSGTKRTGTNLECLALCVWEHMWNGWHYKHWNTCGTAGYICMGTNAKFLVLNAWEHSGMAGTTCGNKYGVEGTLRIRTNVE
jgi:hypothetical protein